MTISGISTKKKRGFSLKLKLLIIFSIVMTVAIMSFGFSISYTTRQTVKEKIETHIQDKANDVAEIINEKILQLFTFSERIACVPFLLDNSIPHQEKITRTIRQLNSSIENQATSVAQSSSSIEEMVANIMSITGTLQKTDTLINELRRAIQDSKETFAQSNTVTNKIAEESSTQGKTIPSKLESLSGEIAGLSESSKIVETKFNAIFSKEMEKLDGLTHVIKDSMDEMAQGAMYIANAMQEVSEIANKNMISISGLLKEVGTFKI